MSNNNSGSEWKSVQKSRKKGGGPGPPAYSGQFSGSQRDTGQRSQGYRGQSSYSERSSGSQRNNQGKSQGYRGQSSGYPNPQRTSGNNRLPFSQQKTSTPKDIDTEVPLPQGESCTIVASTGSPGTIGVKKNLLTNHFLVKYENITVYQYEIEMNKPGLSRDDKLRWQKRVGLEILQEFSKNSILHKIQFFFDRNRNLFLKNEKLKLESNNQTFPLKLSINGREEDVTLTPKYLGYVNLNDFNQMEEKEFTVFNAMFHFFISNHLQYEQFGGEFFDMKTAHPVRRNRALTLVRGFLESVRPTQCGLSLNIHLRSAFAFVPEFDNLSQIVASIAGEIDEKIDWKTFDQINRTIKNLKIRTQHVPNKMLGYVVEGLTRETPQTKMIPDKKITVAQFFREQYNIEVKNFPLVKCNRNCVLPLELCFVKNQQFLSNRKADLQMQDEQLKFATNPPNVYFDKVTKIAQKIAGIEALKSFGIKASVAPMNVVGRVLPPVKMMSSQQQFFEPVTFDHLIVVYFNRKTSDNATKLGEALKDISVRSGMKIKQFRTEFVDIYPQIDEKLRQLFQTVQSTLKNSIIVAIIPDFEYRNISGEMVYASIKYYGDVVFGVPTQGVKSKKIERISDGYVQNILLKLNGKANGTNRAVNIEEMLNNSPLKNDTMVVGMDVNHPGATEKNKNSIVASVGSYDKYFTKFSSCVRIQPREGTETIKMADEMLKVHIDEYFKINKRNPANIVLFRDGVSEGQLKMIRSEEIKKLRKITEPAKIKLILLVVQKRHKTRFALQTMEKGSFNVTAGTIVDQFVPEPNEEVFYLASHNSQLGTSKPAKYILMANDLKLSKDKIQIFCNLNCSTSIRTNKPISIPVPVKYADLCAYRAKILLERDSGYHPGQFQSREERMNVSDNLKKSIYYG